MLREIRKQADPSPQKTRQCAIFIALCVLAAITPIVCLGADAASRYFEIPPQDLHGALSEFARQADRQILFATQAVGGRQTNGVKGEFEVEAALQQLLKDTGLTYRVTADRTILVEVSNTADNSGVNAPGLSSATALPSARRSSQLPQQMQNENASRRGTAESGTGSLLEEVLVTGTFIRGVSPVGTNVMNVSSIDVSSTGAISASQLLTNIPLLSGFNSLDSLPENTQITIKRPNLRSLPGLGASGGSTTLVLLDGHRLVGAGVQQTAPDPDVVPPKVVERIEVIPDGGSATYGADAVGGVINFITRRRFDGFQAGGRYGIAQDYETYDLNAMAGHDWGSGSAYVSLSYATHDDLFGRDRVYVRHYDANGGPAADLGCDPGTVAIRTGLIRTLYAIPSLVPNTSNTCDTSDDAAFYPREEFQSVFASLSQDLGQSLQLDIRGFYSQREVDNVRGPFRTDGATITDANPFYARTSDNIAPEPAAPQSVTFSWAPVSGNAAVAQNTKLESWGITPAAAFGLGHSWQVRALGNFGRSNTIAQTPTLNSDLLDRALAGTTIQTAVNPYNIAATPNQQLLAHISNYEFYGQGRQELLNFRAIADGELLPLPGGKMRLAFGMEYMREDYEARTGEIVPGAVATLGVRRADRNNRSAFAELSVPIVGNHQAVTAIHSLNLSASVRYDNYSDFGATTNPKYAITYQPLEWITIRGNWSTSFNAPSLADAAGALNQATIFPALTLPSPLPGQFAPAQAFWPLIALQGGVQDIQPQTAETFSAGFVIESPVMTGLTLSANYYRILLEDLIGFPPVFNSLDFYSNYTQFYILGPTQQQVQSAVQDIPRGENVVAGLFDPGDPPIYVLVDARRRNLGKAKLSGIDFSLRYVHETSFGSVDTSFSGTYELERWSQPLPTLSWIDQLDSDISRFRSVGTLGATIGRLRTQLQWNHSEGFRTQTSSLQSRIDSFDVINVFFSQDLSGPGLFEGVQLTLNVNNVFDEDPPLFRGTYGFVFDGYANGGTLGRLILLGARKSF